jgi:hypothetical protein
MRECVGSAARITATWLQPPCGTGLVGAGPRWTLDSPREREEVPDRQTVEAVLAVERGSVRFGGFAERPEIREDTRGLAQERERDREAREEVRVVGGGSCVDCCRLKDESRKERSYVQTVQPRKPHQTSQPRTSQFNGECQS